jgi:hypothetical protein
MEGLQRAVAMCELSKCLSGQVSDSLVCNVSFINSLKFDDLSVDHSGVLWFYNRDAFQVWKR